MFRKPLFWIIAVAMAAGFATLAWIYFPKAFPVVTVEITMDRQMAMDRAEEIARTFGMGPDDNRIAASYNLNSRLQNFVELEVGGAEAFRDVLSGGLYSPYTWRVRLFREQSAHETLIRFTPQGEPWGFVERLPEDEPGAVLPADSARALAEMAARDFWQIDLDQFTLVESSENLRLGGRLDHSFVYERTDVRLGEAEYRLRLRISGDKFTELTHFVRIPEAFDRRYEELRSKNATLGNVATVAMLLLFGVIGCGFGLFYLLRQRYVLWKQPAVLSTIVAFLVMLTMFNSWPMQWMSYDTAISFQNYIITQVAMAVISFVAMAALFTVIVMAAESLTRKAFPHHINFWKLWSPGVASSKQVLGITAAAFLLVAFELSYVTGTYYFTSNVLGWWYPSSALFNPNVIAEYFPWLTAFSISLQAALWEEALFRAVPIAGAVLIGKRYGGTMIWVSAAFILQAVIFGAAHADYPQQPFYARTLELIFPSLVFGLLFWFLGLYAAILLHFWYNFVLFSLSIFATDAPGMFSSQIMVILLGLLPFGIILIQSLRSKSLGELPDAALNGAWTPPEAAHSEWESTSNAADSLNPTSENNKEIPTTPPVFTPTFLRVLMLLGVAGFLAWILATDFTKHAPPIEIYRAEALLIADQNLQARNIELDDAWQPFSRVFGGINMEHRFIWEQGGPEVYQQLMGSYLNPPFWNIRYVTFEGKVDERAEEFRIAISGRDSLNWFRHVLPEKRAGATLTEAEARELAARTVFDVHALDPENLRFISASSSSLPERTDWILIYADTLAYTLDKGEARIIVRIGGDEVVGTNRYIHVPEEWTREYRDNRAIPEIIEMTASILLVVLFLIGVVSAIIRWAKGNFSVRAFMVVFTGMMLLSIGSYLNMWPITTFGFSTAQSYSTQVLTSFGIASVGWIIINLALGLVAGLVHRMDLPVSNRISGQPGAFLSLSAFPVFIVSGATAVLASFTPSLVPVWGNAGMAGAAVPLLAGMLGPINGFVANSLLIMLVVGWVHQYTDNWQRRKLLFGGLLFLAGFILSGTSVSSIQSFLISGALSGVVAVLAYTSILRHHTALIIPMVALYGVMSRADALVSPMFPGDNIAWILGSLLIGLLAWYWYRSWETEQ